MKFKLFTAILVSFLLLAGCQSDDEKTAKDTPAPVTKDESVIKEKPAKDKESAELEAVITEPASEFLSSKIIVYPQVTDFSNYIGSWFNEVNPVFYFVVSDLEGQEDNIYRLTFYYDAEVTDTIDVKVGKNGIATPIDSNEEAKYFFASDGETSELLMATQYAANAEDVQFYYQETKNEPRY